MVKDQKEIFGVRVSPTSTYRLVDFYCHEIRLAIEVDGSSHLNKHEYDLRRQRKLENLGVRFKRFEGIDVKRNLNQVFRALIDFISMLENIENREGLPDIPLATFKGGI